jgi:hypothetical protein
LAADQHIERFGQCSDQWRPNLGEMRRTFHDPFWAKANGHWPLHRRYRRKGYGVGLSLCADQRVRPCPIIDLREAADRECLAITSESGRRAVVAADHPFLLTDGRRRPATSLRPGDRLWVRQGYQGYIPGTNPYRISRGLPRGGGYDGQGFPVGERNPAFVGGQWSAFQAERQRRLELIGHCERCERTAKGYELHHLDGDRANNAPENLQLLCVPCHKRAEYQAGRTRRGQKGYPIQAQEIVAVEALGIRPVIEVVMDQSSRGQGLCVDRILL